MLAQKSPSVFKLKHIVTGKQIETHIENLKIVKESEAQLEDIPQARIPLHPLEDSIQENAVDTGHLPLPVDESITAPRRAAAATDTPPGVIAKAREHMDVPASTSQGATSENHVRLRRGQPRAAKRGTNRK